MSYPEGKHQIPLHVPYTLYAEIRSAATASHRSVTAWMLNAAREKLERDKAGSVSSPSTAPVAGASTEPTGSSLAASSSMVVKACANEYIRLKHEFEAATTEEDRDRLLAALVEIKPEMEGKLRMWRKNKPLAEFV